MTFAGREEGDGIATTGGSNAPQRAARTTLTVVGLAAVVAAFFVPTLRTAGGGTSLEGWWTAQTGFAVVLAAQSIGRGSRRAFLFAALFVLATAAQLALTTPLWLQYLDLRPARVVSGTSLIATVILGLQAVVVACSVRGRASTIRSAARLLLRPRAAIFVVLAFAFTAAHATPLFREHGGRGLPAYLALLVAAAGLLVLNVATLALFAEAVPAGAVASWRTKLGAWFTLPGQSRPPTTADVWLPRVLALGVLAATVGIVVLVLHRVVHIPDEVAYRFQARCIAAGRLSAPAPSEIDAFGYYLLDVRDGRWFSTTNPGWPAVLALGVLVGAPWLVNPALAALCVLLTHSLVRRWSDRGTAHVVTLLLASSPWFLFLAASEMTHMVTFALFLGAWSLLSRSERPVSAVAGGIAGLLLGLMVVVRPMDGLVAGAFTGAWLLATNWPRVLVAVPYAIGCVVGASPLFAFNASLTGNPLQDPMNVYLARIWPPGANRLGFGADIGAPGGWGGMDPMPGHGPLDALVNINQNLYNLNFELFGWTIGSLALVLVHMIWGRWSAIDRRLGLLCLTLVAAFSCYWFSGGPDFGARYWFLLILPCLWLTMRGAATLGGLLRDRHGVVDATGRVGAVVVLLTVAGLGTFVPWRAVARYLDYRGFHADYLRMAESGTLGHALVRVRSTAESDVASALILDPPTLDAQGPIFARDLGPDSERRLRALFPDRTVVHVTGRSGPGSSAQIDEAPR